MNQPNSTQCLHARSLRDLGALTQEQKTMASEVEELPLQEEFDALSADIEDLSRRMDSLRERLGKTPDTPPRTLASSRVNPRSS